MSKSRKISIGRVFGYSAIILAALLCLGAIEFTLIYLSFVLEQLPEFQSSIATSNMLIPTIMAWIDFHITLILILVLGIIGLSLSRKKDTTPLKLFFFPLISGLVLAGPLQLQFIIDKKIYLSPWLFSCYVTLALLSLIIYLLIKLVKALTLAKKANQKSSQT